VYRKDVPDVPFAGGGGDRDGGGGNNIMMVAAAMQQDQDCHRIGSPLTLSCNWVQEL
jgi:hypothetical protein